MKATVSSLRPTTYGYQVKTNKGMFYVAKQLFPNGMEPGVELEFEVHKAGDAYPKSFGTEGTFKTDGIHDVTYSVSNAQANIAFKASLAMSAVDDL